ncbi:hypothetical protein TNCT_506231 [Trichonephila clavata]|uniref:Uncharacterized protein n=1 Tax=Trichonephila clavata TaxID=2740835 RepID=A0A8X6M1F1_TRICU|nr:hypothetical protein TNCT_506231 [Trichonephila clavata]
MFSAETQKEIITNDKKLRADNVEEISYGTSVPMPETRRTFINDKMHYFEPLGFRMCGRQNFFGQKIISLRGGIWGHLLR